MDTPITPVATNGTPAPTAGADAAKVAVAKYLATKLPPTPAAASGTVSPETQVDKPAVAPTSETGPTDAPPPGTPPATFATVVAQSKRIRELESAAKAAAGTQ